MEPGGNQSNGSYEKCQFCSQWCQKNLPSQKILKKYNEQWGILQKKLILKISQENTCVGVSFLIKMHAYMPASLLKRHCSTGVFLTVIAKFLRASILKSICERLLLRVYCFVKRGFPQKWNKKSTLKLS